MKKHFVILLAGAMLAALSCSKIDNSFEDIHFNITVCNPDGAPSTKALKSGWVNGDVLNIWFGSHADYTPNITLTYNGSTWVASKVSTDILDELGTSGSFKVIWEGNNDLANTFTPSTSGSYTCFTLKDAASLSRVLISNQIGYTYVSETKTLTATINELQDLTSLQVTVPGLAGDGWRLKSAMMVPLNYIEVQNGLKINAIAGAANSYILGQLAADGHVFVAVNIPFTYRTSSNEISFTLTDGTSTYVYNAGNKSLTYNRGDAYSYPFLGIKLPAFDGEDPTPANWIKQ